MGNASRHERLADGSRVARADEDERDRAVPGAACGEQLAELVHGDHVGAGDSVFKHEALLVAVARVMNRRGASHERPLEGLGGREVVAHVNILPGLPEGLVDEVPEKPRQAKHVSNESQSGAFWRVGSP